MSKYRCSLYHLPMQQLFHCVVQGHKGSCNACGTGAAVGLYYVAVNLDSALTKFCQIHY